ncbi:HAD-IB family hydrolase [Gordonia sp. ABSL1-1]|uniref:HAD family hydrolase n=1 Tax=Gordonia sp. ABSL1-1 TaxID=3053923 RepID=UPI0025746549|nr:HAD-IB family hydrolase [Gordonia sp. ABSL1-1]MDL9937528.1 HAD-IB family hydrolase [Gordonia sp. ABSL1-1]
MTDSTPVGASSSDPPPEAPTSTTTRATDSPPTVAAFFDLDKTVIAKSSALAFSRHFFDSGLINRRTVLKSSYTQLVFLLTAADHDQIEQIRRHITRMCRGWNVEQVNSIVRETLDQVVSPLVFAEAAELIADHHRRGHDVVLISASGVELVGPIGEWLGVDHVRASRMEMVDGHYTGNLEFYCHGPKKARAMESMARTHGYRLADCYAYSDSITDIPMLAAVGHPAVVNPDRQLRKHAVEHGWRVLRFSHPIALHRRLRKRAPAVGVAVAGAAAAGLTIGAIILRHRAIHHYQPTAR